MFASVVITVCVLSILFLNGYALKGEFSYQKIKSSNQVLLQNEFLQVIYDPDNHLIQELHADFLGQGNYGANVLAKPFQLELGLSSNQKIVRAKNSEPVWKNLSNGKYSLEVASVLTVDNVESILEEWNVSLDSKSRAVTIDIKGKVLNNLTVTNAKYPVYVNNPSIYGLFEHGSFQMMDQPGNCLGSTDNLVRTYFMGNGGAVDVIFQDNDNTARENVFVSTTAGDAGYRASVQHVISNNFPGISKTFELAWNRNCWSNASPVTLAKDAAWSFQTTLLPNNYDFPAYAVKDIANMNENMNFLDLRSSLTGMYGSPIGCVQSYYDRHDGMIAPTIAHPNIGYYPKTNFFDPDNFISLSAMIYSNDEYLLNEVRKILLKTGDTMCGIGSLQNPVVCNSKTVKKSVLSPSRGGPTVHSSSLQPSRTGPSVHVSSLQPSRSGPSRTLRGMEHHEEDHHHEDHEHHDHHDHEHEHEDDHHHKDREYHDLPETFTNHYGQIMHHFDNLVPDYKSIAGSIQLGPNIFWTLTALKYISLTQNNTFAKDFLPYAELSTSFLLSLYDEKVSLINAPGPLWIDVFVRENYTTDSNAMFIPYLQEVANFYDYMSYKPDDATKFRSIAKSISNAINERLWNSEENDHFVTQLNTDLITTRDFVDYDSNLIALAFGVLDGQSNRISAVFDRIERNPAAHARATWVSEKEYTGEPTDCYSGPVGNGLCGDSNMTMARIGWVDSLARKRYGDVSTYQNKLLTPLQNDLIQNVWLTERYDENGNAIRTPYYFEYASLVPIMLHDVSYGIDINLLTITINPLVYKEFDYQLGGVKIFYHPTSQVVLSFPGDEKDGEIHVKETILYGCSAGQSYEVKNSCTSQWDQQSVVANSDGILKFPMKYVKGCSVTISIVTK
jgi:hypothetical protein